MGLRQGRSTQRFWPRPRSISSQSSFTLVHRSCGVRVCECLHRGETGNNQRQRGGNGFSVPSSTWSSSTSSLCRLEWSGPAQGTGPAYGFDGFVQARVFARVTGCRHPVGRQLDAESFADAASGDVGQRFTDGQRPDAGESSRASGVRSPMAIASPVVHVEAGGGDRQRRPPESATGQPSGHEQPGR